MIYQLREYRISEASMDEWLAVWSSAIRPLRVRLGFEVVTAWVDPERQLFSWIIGHTGDFDHADKLYFESPERRAVDPDPARFIKEVSLRFISLVSCST